MFLPVRSIAFWREIYHEGKKLEPLLGRLVACLVIARRYPACESSSCSDNCSFRQTETGSLGLFSYVATFLRIAALRVADIPRLREKGREENGRRCFIDAAGGGFVDTAGGRRP